MDIRQSTIYGNDASVSGGGVASLGFDPEREDPDETEPIERRETFFTGNFENELFPWVNDVDKPWSVERGNAQVGEFSAGAGKIGNNDESILSMRLEMEEGEITFARRVSSELGKDFLKFFIDGIEMGAWSGDIGGYRREEFDVSEGTHVFQWAYIKDESGKAFLDTAFIDDVTFPNAIEKLVPEVFSGETTTTLRSSIIIGNTSNIAADDVGSFGMTDPTEEQMDQGIFPEPMEPQIRSRGFNLLGVLSFQASTENRFLTLPPEGTGDIIGIRPFDVFIQDPITGTALLGDFGGVLPVYMPDSTKLGGRRAIEHGDPFFSPNLLLNNQYDQRGFPFVRDFQLEKLPVGVPNGSIETAQNVDEGNWNLDFDVNIFNSTAIPHLTIEGIGDDNFDYYSFTIADRREGRRGGRGGGRPVSVTATFDIDFGQTGDAGSFNTELFLYTTEDTLRLDGSVLRPAGTLLASNDDFAAGAGAGGSTSDFDSFLVHTFSETGTFAIGVGKFDSMGDPEGISGNFPEVGDTYTLQISIENHSISHMDIGAAEIQEGNFLINTLVDESDGRYSPVLVEVGTFPDNFVSSVPDFSLREALEFALKNQLAFTTGTGANTVTFSRLLDDPLFNTDPTPFTSAPTILLTLGELFINFPLSIQGPTSFELEIDASGNDPTPGINDGQGSRVFNFFDSDTAEISNLIIRGGDSQEFGGAIFTNSDLTLRNSTILDSATTGKGGGIYVEAGTVLVDATTIHDNLAASTGGGS
ncbi:MAG: hypothetical protein IH898_02740, partial [Planctomycetes bacterium]|nr:hypothetical protein [Planctomycetota bacterium]